MRWSRKVSITLHSHNIPADKKSALDELQETLASSLKEVEKLQQEENLEKNQIAQRLQRLSDFQGYVKESVSTINRQMARLKEEVKDFCENETKLAQDLPPIAQQNQVDNILNGIKFEESVITQIGKMNEHWNKVKKSASKRLNKRTNKIKREIQAKIAGQPKKQGAEINENQFVEVKTHCEPFEKSLEFT